MSPSPPLANMTVHITKTTSLILATSLKVSHAGFEVLTFMVTKIFIPWHITLCSLLKVNRYFGKHVSPSSGLKEAKCSSETTGTFNGLYDVIRVSLKIEIF
jgi:hypothetical protein